jgi:hypothetical protein
MWKAMVILEGSIHRHPHLRCDPGISDEVRKTSRLDVVDFLVAHACLSPRVFRDTATDEPKDD